MGTRISRILVIIIAILMWPYQPVAIGAKPLSVVDIVRLLQELKVTPQTVAEAVRKHGVNFEVTDAVRKQLRDAGADDGLLLAIERESMAYVRKGLADERRKIEEEKKLATTQVKDEAKRKQAVVDAQRSKDEEEAKRQEEARQKKERKQREAEVAAAQKAKAEAEREAVRRRAEEEREKAEKERNRTSEVVSVPAGSFFMGCNEEVDTECDNDEKPGRQVSVEAFSIDKTEVTVVAYQRCVDAGRCTAPNTGSSCNWNVSGRENHPINCVDWNQAKTYCEWAGKWLPTEANGRKRLGGQTDVSIRGGIRGMLAKPMWMGLKMGMR